MTPSDYLSHGDYSSPGDPHRDQPVRRAGRSLDQARAAMILLHGRGATAEDILMLAYELEHPDIAYLAPQAAGSTWYPNSFLAPIPNNEPDLSSALALVGRLVDEVVSAGVSRERILIAGFSQGACLGLEYVARNAGRFGGLVGYSGGLIGPQGTPREYAGSLDGTPVFLGCSDVDFHIPKERVEETARVLGALGGDATMRLYPGLGHTINQNEIDHGLAMVTALMLRFA
jgi:phospholipase/carboxylesterase